MKRIAIATSCGGDRGARVRRPASRASLHQHDRHHDARLGQGHGRRVPCRAVLTSMIAARRYGRETEQEQRWTVEGPYHQGDSSRYHLARDFLKAGDVIEAVRLRSEAETRKDRSRRPDSSIAICLLMPDGQMQLWGPYGKLDNCVRADRLDGSRWLRLPGATPMARDLWCNNYVASIPLSPLASKPLVDDINGQLATPLPLVACQPTGRRRELVEHARDEIEEVLFVRDRFR